MNIFHDFTDRIRKIVQPIVDEQSLAEPPDLDRIVVELPRDPSHGDLSCNAAMVLAKALGVPPRQLATRIAAGLARDPDVDAAEVAGPGFINLRLRPAYWQKMLKAIVAADDGFGKSAMGDGAKVNVEYVSANPTGPMHVGHCRGAVFGDALANLLVAAASR